MATKTTRKLQLSGTAKQADRAAKGLPKGAKCTVKGNTLTVKLPINFRPSSSGKSNLIASTGGFKAAGCKYQGHDLRISVNLYTYHENNPFAGDEFVEFQVPLGEGEKAKKMTLVSTLNTEVDDGVRLSVNVGYYA